MTMDTRVEPPVVQAGLKRQKPVRWRKTFGILVAVLLLFVLAWTIFAPHPLPVEVATVTQGPLQVTIDNQGQIRAHDKYVVAAPVAAELQRISLHDGDPVKKDQIIATLNLLPLDARQKQEATARLDGARALAREAALRAQRAYTDLQFAASERARVEQLVENQFLSAQAAEKAITAEKTARAEWDAARSREQAARADIKAAQAALMSAGTQGPDSRRRLDLTSPVDGYALKVHEKSERTVNAGMPLVTIGDPTRYEIVVDVLSTDAVKIRPGQEMLLEGWGGGNTLRATVRLVEPVAFTKISALGVEEQRVNIIADPVDDLGPLGDGYRIEARVVIWAENEVVKAPGSSLFRVGEQWHLFVVENGHARERVVTVGQRNQDEAQLLSGVQPGTVIVRFPNNQMKDGARVVAADNR